MSDGPEISGNIPTPPATPYVLPPPTLATLGGLFEHDAVAHKFLRSINNDGTSSDAQPDFTDLSGQATTAQNGVAVVDTAGQGYFVGGIVHMTQQGLVSIPVAITNNQVFAYCMVLPFRAKVTKATVRMSVAGGAGTVFGVALYSADKATKLAEWSFNGNIITAQTVTIAQVDLPPGTYWFAFGFQNTTMRVAGITAWISTGDAFQNRLFYGVSSNSMSGGIMPSSLGNVTSSANGGLPLVIFEA